MTQKQKLEHVLQCLDLVPCQGRQQVLAMATAIQLVGEMLNDEYKQASRQDCST